MTTQAQSTGNNATATRANASRPLRIGMDMVRPYGVYLDARQVAEYDNQAEAEQHFQRLRRIYKTGSAA
jgi:hypothetical protein